MKWYLPFVSEIELGMTLHWISFINFQLLICSNLKSLKIICVLFIHTLPGLCHQKYSDHIESIVATKKACVY